MEQRGEPIPGSKYFRDFCCKCRDPIRVATIHAAAFCEDCDPLMSFQKRATKTGTYDPNVYDATYHGGHMSFD